MIGRALGAPRLDVDATAGQPGQQLPMHQDQVDAQAVVAAESALAVVPPAEGLLGLLEMPEGIDELEIGDAR